jgi:hypothetical protein
VTAPGPGWTVLAGAVGGALALAGSVLTKLWDDRRTARRDKAERLRAMYAPLAQAASILQGVVHAQSFVLDGETAEERDTRHAGLTTGPG